MLKGISPLLSPELLKALDEMGHGDTLVIADGNFPAESVGKNAKVIRADGHGVPELLERLRQAGCKVAIVSNKPHGAACELAEQFFPGVPTFGESPATPRKPAPDMVLHALAALGADKDTAVYVGDSEVDVQTARNAGLPLIAVSWGFRGRRALAETGAAVIVDTAEEIV